jgi:uncharacterized protein YndB with AHSA1/START domain
MKKWILRGLLGLAGLLALLAGGLALMAQRADAGVSRAAIEIAATPEALWPWFNEPDKYRQWVGWVTNVEIVNPELPGVGRKAVTTMREPGSAEPVRVESVVSVYEQPHRIVADIALPGFFTGSQTVRLVDLNGRTRVEMENRIHYTMAIVRLLEPLATPSATAKLEQDLAALKSVAEKP